MKLAGTALFLAGLFVSLQIGGCTIGPDYQRPDLSESLPDRWPTVDPAGPGGGLFADDAPQVAWWESFEDPCLSSLIDDLVTSNLTLARARERIVEVRARRGIVNANQLPQADLTGQATRAGTGEEAVTFQGPPPGREADIYGLGAVAGWEIDLWGRVGRLVEAGDHDIEAEQAVLRDIAVSLTADLALVYIEARTLESRLALLDQKRALLEQGLALSRVRETAGNGTRLARVRAEHELHLVEALRPELDRQLKVGLNAIAVLLGQPPRGEELPPGELPVIPELIGLGLPAELLERRADIRAAEKRYAASVARIGAAMAEKYPRLSLTGSFILQSDEAGNLLDPQALVYSLGPGLRFPLLSGGRIDSQVRARQSQSEQARLALEQKLIVAVREVEDAAAGVIRRQLRLEALTRVQDSARQNRAMTADLYQAGLENRDALLAAESELLASEERLLQARHDTLRQIVLLYRSLGGGWSAMAGNDPTAAAAIDNRIAQ